MPQFPIPGVQQQYVGHDYRGTKGLYVPPSGGNADKAVNFAEADAMRSGLQGQVNLIKQNIKSNIPVAVRWNGTVASLRAALVGFPVGLGFIEIQGAQVKFAPTNMTNADVRSQGHDYLILVDDGLPLSTTTLSTGFYYFRAVNPAIDPLTLIHADFINPELIEIAGNTNSRDGVGSIILVDKGTYSDSFYTIAHAVDVMQAAIGQNYINGTQDPLPAPYTTTSLPKLVISPWGRLQDLQPDPASFLTIASNQIGANISSSFEVVSGQLRLSTAFLAVVSQHTTDIASLVADLAALDSTVGGHTAELATIGTTLTTQATAIAANATAIANITTNILPTAIPQSIAQFASDTHIIAPLATGVFDSGDETTIFEIALPAGGVGPTASSDWAVARLSETAAPYTVLSPPRYDYTGGATPKLKVTFYNATQVPDNTVEVFAHRFFRTDPLPLYVYDPGS